MHRLPPALAASATPRILELLGEPPARVLELGFAGIHAAPLRLAGFEVVVVEPDPRRRARAAERAGEALAEPPPGRFDAVVAPAGEHLGGLEVGRIVLVAADGTASLRA
ncbi:MAG: Methyltransferase domain [Actinomycetota bacterium]